MHDVVHDDEPSGGRGVLGEGVPRVEQHGDVVVPVQEDERLLPQHDEDGVAQLGNLGQHERQRPEAGDAVTLDEAEEEEERERRRKTMPHPSSTVDSLTEGERSLEVSCDSGERVLFFFYLGTQTEW